MSTLKHPDMDQLIDYVEARHGESDRHIALHLARCNECRVHVSNLIKLREQVKSMAGNPTTRQNNSLSREDEKAIVGNHLDSEQRNRIKRDKQKLKAALYLSSQVSASKNVSSQTKVNQRQAPARSPRASLWQRLLQLLPQWEYAAMAASLTLAVVFGLTLLEKESRTSIVAYHDNPVVVFKQIKQNTPGIGFFSDAINTSQAYAGATFRQSGKRQLTVEWPNVKKADSYLFQLYHVVQGNNELVYEKRTLNTSLLINDIALGKNTRYEWKLSGNTSDQRRFSANGGFVLQ